MEDQKLSAQESMALITAMIENSKHRVAGPNLRISVVWALLSIVTAIVVFIALLATGNPAFNWLWLAIPLIGLPANLLLSRKCQTEAKVRTFIDRVHDGLWRTVGLVAIVLVPICLVFNLYGYPQAWMAMFFYAFVVVGFAAAVQGILLREPSYVFGGIFSVIAGFVVIAVSLCGIPLLVVWVLPLYAVCFLLMFIVPAVIVGKKLQR